MRDEEALGAHQDEAVGGDHMADLHEAEHWCAEDEALARDTMARDLPESKKEINHLEYLIRLAQTAEDSVRKRKLHGMRKVMSPRDPSPRTRNCSSSPRQRIRATTW